MMEDLWPSGQRIIVPWCAQCKAGTPSERGACGHLVCAVCGRCPPCDGPLEAA